MPVNPKAGSRLESNRTKVMKMGNGQCVTTLPAHIVRKMNLDKGTVLEFRYSEDANGIYISKVNSEQDHSSSSVH